VPANAFVRPLLVWPPSKETADFTRPLARSSPVGKLGVPDECARPLHKLIDVTFGIISEAVLHCGLMDHWHLQDCP